MKPLPLIRTLSALFLLIYFHAPVSGQHQPAGPYEGAIHILGAQLMIKVEFQSTADSLKATIDIPQQNAKGLALKNVTFSAPKIHFELPAGPGLAVFNGEVRGDSIVGSFTQAGLAGTFHLLRGSVTEIKPVSPPSVPYNVEEVVFYNGEIKFAGTLTLPKGNGPFPAVVLLTGSGPQNRDEELFGFKPFAIIADDFTRKGIAVLRYDDRGVGRSTGDIAKSTTTDFAGDALAAIHFLQARPAINPKQIGLCGHSEGGLIAPLAASQSQEVAFIILLAGPAVSGGKILSAQLELIMKANGAPQPEIQKALQLNDRIYAAVKSGKGWDQVENDIRSRIIDQIDQMPSDKRSAITNVEEFVGMTLKSQLASVQSAWFKFFLEYDPAPALRAVEWPFLALFGELDLQVPAEMNRSVMEEVLRSGKTKDVTIKVFPQANHLFQTAVTGNPSEYATLKKEFVPGLLNFMSDWILKRTTTSIR